MIGKIHESGFEYLKCLKNGAMVVDIGANIGQSIVSIYNSNSTLNIIAFEPNSACRKSLKQQVSIRPLKNRVRLYFCGLGASVGKIPFFTPVSVTGIRMLQESTFGRSVLFNSVTKERLSCSFSIDEILCDIKSLDEFEIVLSFIKIDDQGFELGVLRGGARTIREHRPAILIENGDYIVQ